MSIVEDNNGNYWLGTDNGISCFTPPENPFDEKIKIRFRNYTQSDGLPSRETDGFNAFKDKDGALFFGTKNAGFFSFHPEELVDNSFIPPVYITAFKLFNKPVEPNAKDSILKLPIELTKEIILAYNQNVIAFEFAALNFFHPERNQYAYMLEGYDKDWIYTDASKPFVDYTNLDPREYIFKVKGSNNDGVWNDIPATIKLIITPPFWQTWWFRILVVLAVSAVIYGFYRNRINQILLLQKIRNKIAADLHDDIGSTLNSISVYSEVAKKDPSQQNFALDMIGESSRKVIESMSDIVWSINPENDGFDKIILRMRSLSYNLMKAKKIEFTFRTDETLHEIKLPMEMRRNFYLIFKEAMNNLVKYSHAQRASVLLTRNNREITCVIHDDGIGFDVSAKFNGNGLNNIRRRAKEIEARLNIESKKGMGTNIGLIMNV
jgi:two-component sensor histidine kinase